MLSRLVIQAAPNFRLQEEGSFPGWPERGREAEII